MGAKVFLKGMCLFLFLSMNLGLYSQTENMVFNPSFEEYVECPKKIDANGVMTIVEGWFQPTLGSADYYHVCGQRECRVPNNKLGEQTPHSGNAYCGIYCSKTEYREYLQTQLKYPLVQGNTYKLSFYVSLSEYSTGAIATLGGLFTAERISDFSREMLTFKSKKSLGNKVEQIITQQYVPQVNNPYSNVISDTKSWTLISGEFVAEGGERFLTIGNFFPASQSNLIYPTDLTNMLPGSYYFIDDIEVICVKQVNTHVVEESFIADKEKLETGRTIILENIFFDFDKSLLLQQSYYELNKLYEYLVSNPKLRIEIGGHTDSKGSEEYNQRLSEQRAKSVVDYLIRRGIPSNHLKYKGYGELKPIADNETEEGRKRNRRVELKVLSR